MTSLQFHKRTLLLESGLNRLTLRAECGLLRRSTNWAGRFNDARRKFASWTPILASLAGTVLALGFCRCTAGTGWFKRLLQIAPSLLQLWRAFGPP